MPTSYKPNKDAFSGVFHESERLMDANCYHCTYTGAMFPTTGLKRHPWTAFIPWQLIGRYCNRGPKNYEVNTHQHRFLQVFSTICCVWQTPFATTRRQLLTGRRGQHSLQKIAPQKLWKTKRGHVATQQESSVTSATSGVTTKDTLFREIIHRCIDFFKVASISNADIFLGL